MALQIGIQYGLILSAFMTVVVFASLRYNAVMWLGDYPPDIQQAFGPMDDRSRQQRNVVAALSMLGLLAIIILDVNSVVRAGGGWPGLLPVYLSLFVAFQLFNLVDLILIDWIILIGMKPRWSILPGTEGMAGYSDFLFPAIGFMKGFVGITLVSGVVTLIAWGVVSLLA